MDPQTPLSISYLDQIAPSQQRNMSNKTKLILVVAGVIAAILAGWFALSTFNEPTAERNDLLQYRLVTLRDTAEQAQDHLTDSNLRSANANLVLFSSNAIAVYGEPKFSKNKPSAAQAAEDENSALLSETLEDARLNAIYDRVYLREMLPQLASVKEALSYLASTTSSQDQKAAYQESNDQLAIIIEDFTKSSHLD